MTEMFEHYPVLVVVLALSVLSTIGMVVWAGFDSSPRGRRGQPTADLDDLLDSGHRR